MSSFRRQKILTVPVLAKEIISAFEQSKKSYQWAVGRYVIMPDHVHFFCQPDGDRTELSEFIRLLKKWTTRRAKEEKIGKYVWQREFFDHLLRSGESYEQKWEYVFYNPVRAGLCKQPEEWPYQGECHELIF
ncbi:MAG: transposase [bacterium]